jgi:MFS transporter, FHS family, Na+ dependent glucose transporter 1
LFNRISALPKDEAVRRTFNYYFLFICLGLVTGIGGPTLPALAEQTGIRLGQMGYLFMLNSIGFAVGTILGGRVFDRMRGHPVLGMAQLISATLIFFIPLAPRFWLLLAIMFSKGLSEGLVNTGTNTLLVWIYQEKTGPFMNALHFFFGLGAFLAPFLVAQLTGIPGGYRWAYWSVASIGALVGLRLLFLPGSPKPAHTRTDENGAPTNVFYPLVIAAALFLFFYVGAEITYGGWIYTYATTLNISSAAGAAYMTAGFWLSFTIGRLVSIPMAACFSPRRIILAALTGCLAILGLLVLLPGSNALLWIVTLVLGFCMAPLWPMGFTLAGQSLKLTARLSSIILLGESFGGMLLPWLAGQVIDLTGAQSMVLLVLGSMILNLLAFILLVQLGKRKTARRHLSTS